MKTKFTIFLVALFCSVVSFAQTFTSGGINYTVTSPTTVKVSTHTSFTGAAVIPATVMNGATNYSVTSIGDNAFQYRAGLTSVSIPNSVTSIGLFAFGDCTGLTSVTIPSSVTSIGLFAFNYCTGLTSVSIPNSVTVIDQFVFAGCSSLTSITIPNTITTIGYGAFSNCSGLTTINIPNSVTFIDGSAFQNCTGLTSVTVNWATPLDITNIFPVFSGVMVSEVILRVPSGTIPLYAAAPVWQNFLITSLGTEELKKELKIKFSPNPVTSSITFSQAISSLEIYDISGKKMKFFGNTSTTFNVETLEKGMYLLKGKTADGKNITEKMIKK